MRNLEPGTVIGECECASCGSVRPIKITKKGTAGYRCSLMITDSNGERYQCTGSSWLSKQATAKLVKEYLGTPREDNNDVQQDENKQSEIRPSGAFGERIDENGNPEPIIADGGGDTKRTNTGYLGGILESIYGE